MYEPFQPRNHTRARSISSFFLLSLILSLFYKYIALSPSLFIFFRSYTNVSFAASIFLIHASVSRLFLRLEAEASESQALISRSFIFFFYLYSLFSFSLSHSTCVGNALLSMPIMWAHETISCHRASWHPYIYLYLYRLFYIYTLGYLFIVGKVIAK